MPLAIIIDNSLSMYKEINENGIKTSKREIASLLCEKLIDLVSSRDKYEFISLVSVSSNAQLLTEFTRDFTKAKQSLKIGKPGDCFNLESGLSKISEMVIDTFGCFTNVQILILTNEFDNSTQEYSIKNFYSKLKENEGIVKNFLESIGFDYDENKYFKNSILNNDILNSNYNFEFNKKLSATILPFSFPNRLDVICLQDKTIHAESGRFEFDDDNFDFRFVKSSNQDSKINYLNEIVDLNGSDGKVFCVDNLNNKFICENFLPEFFNSLFDPFDFELKCGNLKSMINLVPSPINKESRFYGYLGKELSSSIEIVGFINIPDFVTPQTISRHAIVPSCEIFQAEEKSSFFMLLYTSLKSENMAAVIKISADSYGAINCGTDGKTDPKKKSHLTLAIFRPDFSNVEAMLSKINAPETKITASPAKGQVQRPEYTKSYAKGCIVWYRAVNLQSDVQKIFRNAKKMNEKMPIFYKELNRVRKAAITFGIYELFQGLSRMFERELVNSANSYNAEASAQLGHVIRCLNLPEHKDYRRDIQPWTGPQSHSKQGRK
ncbi:von Willebrand factor A domain-containing 9 [Brachionus plicatilis]|uniref:von Willebrand factor A domain-containing 9 n=1 Tax=Brachionus plicatilis TaxID=10195 RepID=A0A3M7P5F2_BRAPC|nr:von Willebrand factor A domain-containing 9 [Brachionus plicatilis]